MVIYESALMSKSSILMEKTFINKKNISVKQENH